MSRTAFQLVLIVSCAHALVHVFEISLPSVEQLIGDEFQVGKERTGLLGTVWRVPFGLGALLAGWLADRYGAKRLLVIYLLGCMGAAVLAGMADSLEAVFIAMLTMGCFASIYHPAGLSLISRHTTSHDRGRALGWHGIFGSIGVSGGPFLAALAFQTARVSWRQYYFLLAVPAAIVAALLQFGLRDAAASVTDCRDESGTDPDGERARWVHYGVLVTVGVLGGLVYAVFMHFLPRYLSDVGVLPSGLPTETSRNVLTGCVFGWGIAGQYLAGRLARPDRLEWLLAAILLGNVPMLMLMAVATGPMKLVAACLLALVHFMNQPVYNSLIAHYVPALRRSTGYGFSNMLCFGIGGLGPAFAGLTKTDFATYGSLAIVALLAGSVALGLVCLSRTESSAGKKPNHEFHG